MVAAAAFEIMRRPDPHLLMAEGEMATPQVGIVMDVDEQVAPLVRQVVEDQGEVLLLMEAAVRHAMGVAVDGVTEVVEEEDEKRRRL